MRALLSCIAFAALAFSSLPAVAQDGAPVPLVTASADETYEPQGYVPLPPGADGEVPEQVDEATGEPLNAAPADEFTAPDIAAAPVPVDPMTECTEQAGVDHEGKTIMDKLSDCLKQKHDESEAAMETSATAATARMRVQGKGAARTLTSSNLAFVAFRDSECLRRKNGAANAESAQQVEWACRASMNDSRSQMLQTQ
jgi:uncharacterized protein YecT (DUF1311 family)